MSETPENRLRRLRMRSMRRGIKEMDLILHGFASTHLGGMDDASLALYDRLLEENDHDLYQWVTGRADPPAGYVPLIARIRAQLDAQKAGQPG